VPEGDGTSGLCGQTREPTSVFRHIPISVRRVKSHTQDSTQILTYLSSVHITKLLISIFHIQIIYVMHHPNLQVHHSGKNGFGHGLISPPVVRLPPNNWGSWHVILFFQHAGTYFPDEPISPRWGRSMIFSSLFLCFACDAGKISPAIRMLTPSA
jgi:hypothetical protein